VYEAYDDDVLANQEGNRLSSPPTIASGAAGFYSGFGAQLRYTHMGDTGHFKSWANSALAYYPDVKDLIAVYHQIGLAFLAPLGSRVSLHGSPFAEYSPRYSIRLFPGLPAFDPNSDPSISTTTTVPAPEIDYTAIHRHTYRYGANVGANVVVSSRSTLGIDYGYEQAMFGDVTDMQVENMGVNLGFKLSRTAWLKTGYVRREAWYEGLDGRKTLTQNLNIGVDYLKPLSRTRKTYLQFNSGSAIAEDFSGRRMEAIGSAALVHHIGRTWNARADYRHDVGYIEGFNRPVFSDSAGANFGGLISRRVEFSADSRYFKGAVGLTGGAPRFGSYSAWARVRTAVTRSLAAYVEYLFYHYEFDDVSAIPPGMPPQFHRNGVRIGLSIWVPFVD
jgi:hypothetical protein